MLHRLASVQDVKIFFLVDALDECEPQDRLGDLADVMLWLSHLRNLKLCISCRPWAIFNQRFGKAPVLQLDHLTYVDIAIYIEARLTSTEVEVGLNTDFRDQTRAAKELVYNTARAAEGVFLWTELVITAICSEMRKAKSIKQLDQITSEFPADLDDYFHKLIFDRIGKSRKNAADIAAALKLAMEIVIDNQRRRVELPWAKSYCNFWLLSKGYLAPGFSWTDHIDPSQLQRERMLKQTIGFLEETCKDLLVLHEVDTGLKHINEDIHVQFLHRTVFDYLSQNEIRLRLEQQAPSHFSGQGFLLNLAGLRCICLLSGAHASCDLALNVLDKVLIYLENNRELFGNKLWFSMCESLAITKFRTGCNCFGLDHINIGFCGRYINTGRSDLLIQSTMTLPHKLIKTALGKGPRANSLLGEILQVAKGDTIGTPGVTWLRHILECGSDVDLRVEGWPDDGLYCKDVELDCRWRGRTYWKAWLRETYLDLTEERRRAKTAERDDAGSRVSDRKVNASTIAKVLLSYGADPRCAPCIADHSQNEPCRQMPLDELLEHIIPPERLVELRRIQVACSLNTSRYHLRRNRFRRAIRSLLTSEHNFTTQLANADFLPTEHARVQVIWESEQKEFLASLLDPLHRSWSYDCCSICPNYLGGFGLVSWCVDCGDVSLRCLHCCLLFPSQAPALLSSCGSSSGNYAPATKDHFCVTVLQDKVFGRSQIEVFPGWSEFRVRYDTLHSLSLLKDWYARDPIEPNLVFEDAIRGLSSSENVDHTHGENSGSEMERKSAKRKRESTSP
jgi:hypothetical protein